MQDEVGKTGRWKGMWRAPLPPPHWFLPSAFWRPQVDALKNGGKGVFSFFQCCVFFCSCILLKKITIFFCLLNFPPHYPMHKHMHFHCLLFFLIVANFLFPNKQTISFLPIFILFSFFFLLLLTLSLSFFTNTFWQNNNNHAHTFPLSLFVLFLPFFPPKKKLTRTIFGLPLCCYYFVT